jgi:hypothetical protein
MRLSFRDRFFTPQVARALMSPLGIVLAGIGTAVGVVVGFPVVAAVGIGAVAYAGRVALAIPRGQTTDRIDPMALSVPWRDFVQSAVSAKQRFDRAVNRTERGPLREHLSTVAARLADGTDECWRIARHGDELDEALAQIDVDAVRSERDDVAKLDATEHKANTIEALDAQLASAERLTRVANDARDRLRLLDARLDELVARAIELSVSQDDDAAIGALGTDVDGLVTEMESLRQALEAT